MRIAIDGMGGDNGVRVNVEGAVRASEEFDAEIVLVGQRDILEKELRKYNTDTKSISVFHADEVVDMAESPSFALRRKKNSSIAAAINLAKDLKVDAVISSGNTGAFMISGKLALRTLEGVERPAIAALMPSASGACVFLDVGANVDCKARHLYEFAVMGSIYSEYVLEKPVPKIGVLSIGEEASKGNELSKEVFGLLENSSLNFMGNAEGRDVFNGKLDVVVCDGFVGNVILKASEGLAEFITRSFKEELLKNFWSKLGAFFIRPAYRRFHRKVDYAEYGGAPLLGINGNLIVCHGNSSAKAIKNAVRSAINFVRTKVNQKIVKVLKETTTSS
jgi:glycerol-3-phosphate acyltransferase PlsX